MNRPQRLNDAPILDQLEGQYEKILLMLLWKYLPEGAIVTLADIKKFAGIQLDADPFVLFTHGHKESIDLKCVRTSSAKRLAEHHERTGRGRA